MSTTPIRGGDCAAARQQFDYYVDHELLAETSRELDRHVAGCADCAAELKARLALRDRLRRAATRPVETADLQARIARNLQQHNFPASPAKLSGPLWLSVAAAAAMLALVSAMSYQRGHLRFTEPAQEAYVHQVSALVPPILRVGLGDHVHCAVFRRWTPRPADFEKTLSDLLPQYRALVPPVRRIMPLGYRLVQAHECTHQGRDFIHLQFEQGRSLISVVLANRRAGETFENSGLRRVFTSGGLPVYQAGAQRFQVAGFASGATLVYVVSDLAGPQNSELALAVAPIVHAYLDQIAL